MRYVTYAACAACACATLRVHALRVHDCSCATLRVLRVLRVHALRYVVLRVHALRALQSIITCELVLLAIEHAERP